MHQPHREEPNHGKRNRALETLWRSTCLDLTHAIGEPAFERWFSSIRLARIDDDAIWLRTPNEIYSLWVEENYLADLTSSLKRHLDPCPPVRFELDPAAPPAPPATSTPETIPPAEPDPGPERVSPISRENENLLPLPENDETDLKNRQYLRTGRSAGLSPDYTLEKFVVGDNNRLSHAAATAVAEKPGKTYHPLFIYSGSGLGKTHLLHAIGWEALRRRPKSRVIYITAEEFANEFIESLQKNALVPFRKKYRKADILLIDDVQFLAGKDGMQEEFFHTFNTLSDSHKQIVLASDRPAPEIRNLEERLVSRFQWGMTAEIMSPGIETRIAILRRKREDRRMDVPDSVIDYIAEHIRTNVRAMEGALIRAATLCSLEGSDNIDARLDVILQDFLCEQDARHINLHDIQAVVAAHYDVTVRDINGRRRTGHLALARHVAMSLARDLTGLSLAEIGKEFGGRDHGTVIHAIKKIAAKMEADTGLKRAVEYLRRQLSRPEKPGPRKFTRSRFDRAEPHSQPRLASPFSNP